MSRPVRHALLACTLAAASAATAPGASAAAAVPAAAFGPAGLAKLDWHGTDLLAGGNVELQDLSLDGGPATGDTFTAHPAPFDAARRLSVQAFSWGTIRVAYRPDGDTLHATVEVANTGRQSLTRVGLYLLRWRPPTPVLDPQPVGPQTGGPPAGGPHWDGKGLVLHRGADDFPIVTGRWDGGQFVACNDDPADPFTFGFQPTGDGAYAVAVRFDDGKPIAPGQARRASLSVRLAGPDAPAAAVAGDVLHAFAARHPATLNWPDRRPIGSAFLATSARNYPTNPRGWFLDPNVDVTTVAGRAAFAARVGKYTAEVIAHCKKLNAQGVIVWDLEGQEMPHATSYLADPRVLGKVAPEMDAIADGMFRTYAAAGLRTGVTIRPTRVVPAPDGHGWAQVDAPDAVAEMDAKIAYARKRWGCTVFYLDSNVTYVFDPAGKILDNPTMPAEGFARLAARHKGCLLIPEHKTDLYWASTAPYSEFRLGFTGTPDAVRAAYPHAFSVLQVVDGPNLADPGPAATLAAAVGHGDVLLFRPWWDDPQTPDVDRIYAAARGGTAREARTSAGH